jgi:hypothetical protein
MRFFDGAVLGFSAATFDVVVLIAAPSSAKRRVTRGGEAECRMGFQRH